jgi:hypothetical protein
MPPTKSIGMTLFTSQFRLRLPHSTVLAALAVIVLFGQSGCVQRRMMIRSNPPGARVYVDDYDIGNTPVSVSFTYYGTRKIRLVKDGYETLTVMQKFPTPWYQFVPLDFFSENLVPGTINNRWVLDYQLRPQLVVPTDQLQARAEQLRRNTSGSAAVPLAPPGSLLQQPPPSVLPGPIPTSSPPLSTPPPSAPGMNNMPAGIGGQPVYPLQP